jgi:hypothetical protein
MRDLDPIENNGEPTTLLSLDTPILGIKKQG